jgi:ATP-dependent helicase HrpA
VILAAIAQQLDGLPDALVFEATQAEAIRDRVQSEILERSFQVIEQLERISSAAAAAEEAIAKLSVTSEVAVEERTHIQSLFAGGLLVQAGLEYLPRIEIYLRAIEQRVKKLFENPSRDQKLWAEFLQAQRLFEEYGGEVPPKTNDRKLLEARWMLEELRVNLFAQNLGTKFPISLNRIRDRLLG